MNQASWAARKSGSGSEAYVEPWGRIESTLMPLPWMFPMNSFLRYFSGYAGPSKWMLQYAAFWCL
ncbi:MAG: hypothetical protein U0800_20810 [Isosphaeraceae bacterium]